MTPLEIEILLHYHCRTNDYRDGDFAAPVVRETIDAFRDDHGLIEPLPKESREFGVARTYRLTQRGEVYIAALKAIPLPTKVWINMGPIGSDSVRIEEGQKNG